VDRISIQGSHSKTERTATNGVRRRGHWKNKNARRKEAKRITPNGRIVAALATERGEQAVRLDAQLERNFTPIRTIRSSLSSVLPGALGPQSKGDTRAVGRRGMT